jgi:hypothetical protein
MKRWKVILRNRPDDVVEGTLEDALRAIYELKEKHMFSDVVGITEF